MRLLGREFVVGIREQHVPCPALQQGNVVLYLDRRTVFDHFLCVFQHGTSEHKVATAKHTTKGVRVQQICVHLAVVYLPIAAYLLPHSRTPCIPHICTPLHPIAVHHNAGMSMELLVYQYIKQDLSQTPDLYTFPHSRTPFTP